MSTTVKIKKVLDDFYVVELTFDNGYTKLQRTKSEDEARVYAAGLVDGINAFRSSIEGPRLFPTVEEIKPASAEAAKIKRFTT